MKSRGLDIPIEQTNRDRWSYTGDAKQTIPGLYSSFSKASLSLRTAAKIFLNYLAMDLYVNRLRDAPSSIYSNVAVSKKSSIALPSAVCVAGSRVPMEMLTLITSHGSRQRENDLLSIEDGKVRVLLHLYTHLPYEGTEKFLQAEILAQEAGEFKECESQHTPSSHYSGR
jgi:hypothetical protein